jgi:hypothetical protein
VFVKVLTQAENVVMFVGDSCWILDNKKSRKVIGAGIIDPLNGLYKLTTNSKSVGVHVNLSLQWQKLTCGIRDMGISITQV